MGDGSVGSSLANGSWINEQRYKKAMPLTSNESTTLFPCEAENSSIVFVYLKKYICKDIKNGQGTFSGLAMKSNININQAW